MKILLTGTTGKVGGFLARYWQSKHEIQSLSRTEVDLADQRALADFLEKTEFDLAVNPAAVSTPEACEREPHLARLVNAQAPATIAQACAARGLPMIHFSTDYVLSGTEPGFHDEEAACEPNNHYGGTKLAGERAVLEICPTAIIARVSWVFGAAGEGFLEKVFRQIGEGVALEGVADKYSLPTSAGEIAQALDFLIEESLTGLFHLTQTAATPVSWHRYAEEVAGAAYDLGFTSECRPVAARSLSDIPALRTARPIHTAMRPRRLTANGYPMRDWTEAVHERVAELVAATNAPCSPKCH